MVRGPIAARRVAANAALAAFARRDEPGAEEFARVLPPAPVFPLP